MGLNNSVDAAFTTAAMLDDGTPVRMRPIASADKSALEGIVAGMSAESRSRRFLGATSSLSPRMLRYFTEVDYVNHFALVVSTVEQPDELVGVGRYIRLRDRPKAAEIAAAVVDAYSGRGIGTLVMEALTAVAQETGITTFVASVRQDNAAMRALLPSRHARSTSAGAGVVSYEIDLATRGAELIDRPVYRRYRSAAAEVLAACQARTDQAG